MCILWIGLLSAFMVKLVGWIGAIIGLHPVAMGLIVLAAGTSVPDAIGSYNEAMKGHAGAAVSNALGSNVFDICFGLGVPWFFFSVIKGRCFAVPKDEILIPTFILFGVLMLFLATLSVFNMRLFGTVGLVYLGVYVIFVIWVLVNAYALGNINAHGAAAHDAAVALSCVAAPRTPLQLQPRRWAVANGN
eukprot:gene36463-1230_t